MLSVLILMIHGTDICTENKLNIFMLTTDEIYLQSWGICKQQDVSSKGVNLPETLTIIKLMT